MYVKLTLFSQPKLCFKLADHALVLAAYLQCNLDNNVKAYFFGEKKIFFKMSSAAILTKHYLLLCIIIIIIIIE